MSQYPLYVIKDRLNDLGFPALLIDILLSCVTDTPIIFFNHFASQLELVPQRDDELTAVIGKAKAYAIGDDIRAVQPLL